jgi:polysaccharide biosynthesis protein PslF
VLSSSSVLSGIPDSSGPTPHHVRTVGIVSTFPPQQCGLATFASALGAACVRNGDVVIDVTSNTPPHEAASQLHMCDYVLLQHEYGIFGGEDGDDVLTLLNDLQLLGIPVIVTLHTVLVSPTPHQREVLAGVAARVERVVVMTQIARDRLLALYPVDPEAVVVIAHGATPATPADQYSRVESDQPQLLTWGLIGPGKGIEHVIDAMALLSDITPPVRYVISGVTHPNVLLHEGDKYRDSLIERVRMNGLSDSVTFDASYRTVDELVRFVASASVVVLPYDSKDQVTSGVLVDAVAAGCPVIATQFPHAVELLATGAGIVVPHGDLTALADAIRLVHCDASALQAMGDEARRIAPTLSWDSVAKQYQGVGEQVRERADQSHESITR